MNVVPLLVVALLLTGVALAVAPAPAVDPDEPNEAADGTPPAVPAFPGDPREALLLGAELAGLERSELVRLAAPRPASADLASAYTGLYDALGMPTAVALEWRLLPPALAEPLTRLLDATRDAVLLQHEAMAPLDDADRDVLRTLGQAYRESRAVGDRAVLADAHAVHGIPVELDRTRIAAAALRLVDAALEQGDALRSVADTLPVPSLRASAACLLDEPGLVAICGPEDNVVDGDHILRVDLGGDDTHRGNSGSSGVDVLWSGTNGLPVALLLDVDGHDSYVGGSQVQASGATTPGVLVDLIGNDVYESTARFFNFVQGAGNLGGVGMLHDALGDDVYLTPRGRDGGQTAWDAQGFGILSGIGILHDVNGFDIYIGGTMAQGVGDFQAVGLLLDGGDGADWHEAVRLAQGFADGAGVGVVFNTLNNDVYRLDESIGQAASLGGHGVLIDGDGDDTYLALGQAQGWAVDGPAWKPVNDVLSILGLQSVGTAVLVDGLGRDAYSSGGCQGCIWFGGTGGVGWDLL